MAKLVLPTAGGNSTISMFGESCAIFPSGAPGGLGGRMIATYGDQLVLQNTPGVGCAANGWQYNAITYNASTDSWGYPQLPLGGDSQFSTAAVITNDPSVSDLDTR